VVGATRLKRWLDTISATNAEILQHVRSLSCQIDGALDPPHESVDLSPP